MMRKLLLPMALLVALVGTLTAARSFAKDLPDPLGINLGMTLAEVRKLGHPDKPTGKIELVCTGDELARQVTFDVVPFGKDYTTVGVKVCSFHAFDRDKVRNLVVDVGGHDTAVQFIFTPRSNVSATSERLFTITVSTSSKNFDSLVASYTAKFGKPKSELKGAKAVKGSDILEGRTLTWERAHLSILLDEYWVSSTATSRTTMIAYEDSALGDLVSALVKDKKPGADKL